MKAIAALLLMRFGEALEVKKEEIQVGDTSRTYHVQYPRAVMPEKGWPVVFSFHGFRGWAGGQAKQDGLRSLGARQAVIVHPEGFPDRDERSDYEQSWNGAGSSGANAGAGTDGPICKLDGLTSWRCYNSCKKRRLCSDQCRWAHCEDDVAFVLAILERLQNEVQVDNARVYGTGHSNGALFLYELVSDPRSASVFAAIVPVAGLPHNGFNRGSPSGRTRLLTILGNKDTYVYPHANVPADKTKSYGDCCGWYYSHWENTTSLWASQRKLRLKKRAVLKSRDKTFKMFSCKGWSKDTTVERADVGACFYEGPHSSPSESYSLVWRFFGFAAEAQISEECLKTAKCGGYSCDDWLEWDPDKHTCDSLERDYGCDCSGCLHCAPDAPNPATYRFAVCLVIGAISVLTYMGMKSSEKDD